MSTTIKLPESIDDIKLGNYMRYFELKKRTDLNEYQFDKRKIEIFTSLDRKEIPKIAAADTAMIIDQIDTALGQTVAFEPLFKIKDVQFGFIPNLDEISTGEYIDLKKYQPTYDKEGRMTNMDTMHNFMAILFRPVKKLDTLDNYTIINYKGTQQYAEIMKKMPLSIVNGALVFFWNLADELSSFTLKYMSRELQKERKRLITSRNGAGILG